MTQNIHRGHDAHAPGIAAEAERIVFSIDRIKEAWCP